MNEVMELESSQQKAASKAAPKVPVPVSEQELVARYVAQMNAMSEDASERRMLQVFVDVAAWKLATIAYNCGAGVAGDVIRRLGGHLNDIALRADATREAAEAKSQGRLPQ